MELADLPLHHVREGLLSAAIGVAVVSSVALWVDHLLVRIT